MRPALLLAALTVGPAFADGALAVPSGMPVTFHEMLWDQPGQGLTYRFRFVAPEIGPGGRAFEEVALDMEHLCQTYALPKLAAIGPKPAQIVISLAQKSVEFGQPAPDVPQFFEAYRVEDDTCIWEVF
ncbi:DUF6497 family protein [Aestuariicoccus sp. MJ-SS9]|uniref:DUF6497 family protein n=1 Tax=Aestuariicoccus sp. MJ-SS9 TaxID=3079855 RepID=UPI00290A6AF7|nr:DUF6497 family protein [Aestuariicoccus sp. MJ-SS9]MDU8913246.1 DUF6497 family protein [Aestuariicoccus sp. MJ-SS9]